MMVAASLLGVIAINVFAAKYAKFVVFCLDYVTKAYLWFLYVSSGCSKTVWDFNAPTGFEGNYRAFWCMFWVYTASQCSIFF